jgi:hypothetical protein
MTIIPCVLLSVLCFIVLMLIYEAIAISVYGWYIGGSPYDSIQKEKLKECELNIFNSKIMHIGDLPFVSGNTSILCKWHIFGIGMIPRWSKVHKLLESTHKELIEKKHKSKI